MIVAVLQPDLGRGCTGTKTGAGGGSDPGGTHPDTD